MNVGNLKRVLETLADDVEVIAPSGDHEYAPIHAEVTTALIRGRTFTEDHGEENTPEKVYGKRKQVLVLGR